MCSACACVNQACSTLVMATYGTPDATELSCALTPSGTVTVTSQLAAPVTAPTSAENAHLQAQLHDPTAAPATTVAAAAQALLCRPLCRCVRQHHRAAEVAAVAAACAPAAAAAASRAPAPFPGAAPAPAAPARPLRLCPLWLLPLPPCAAPAALPRATPSLGRRSRGRPMAPQATPPSLGGHLAEHSTHSTRGRSGNSSRVFERPPCRGAAMVRLLLQAWPSRS